MVDFTALSALDRGRARSMSPHSLLETLQSASADLRRAPASKLQNATVFYPPLIAPKFVRGFNVHLWRQGCGRPRSNSPARLWVLILPPFVWAVEDIPALKMVLTSIWCRVAPATETRSFLLCSFLPMSSFS